MEIVAYFSPSTTTSFCRRSLPTLRPFNSLSSTSAHKFAFHHHHKFPVLRPREKLPKISTTTSASNDDSPAATESKSPPPPELPPPRGGGAKLIPLISSLAIGAAVFFLIPRPPEITPQAWQLLSIFLSTIAGLVLSPLPVGAWAFLGLTATILTNTLPFAAAFSAFTNEVIWLIVISFFFARGFVKTGLGDRIAIHVFREMVGEEHPRVVVRADTERGVDCSGDAEHHRQGRRRFLAYYQIVVVVGREFAGRSIKEKTWFLFSTVPISAQNLLCLKLAEQLGVVVSNPWVSWFNAASLPAFLSLIATPLILYSLDPPETKDTPDAPAMAEKKLELMGPMSENELVMIGTMILAVSLWIFGDALGISSVLAAMLGYRYSY
ncbi:hypothetical protein ABFS83_14G097700 [Erythranthe nasuta]